MRAPAGVIVHVSKICDRRFAAMRICCLNNYPLVAMRDLTAARRMPRQHLWGTDELAAAGDVTLVPWRPPGGSEPLVRATRRTNSRLGLLDQQAYALRHGPFDAYYSGDQRSLRGIALLRRAVARRARVVSVVHHPEHAGFPVGAMLQAHTGLLALSDHLRSELIRRHGLDERRIQTAHWGPDLGFAGYAPGDERHGVVSAGKTNRDLATLVGALRRAGAPGVVYDLDGRVEDPPAGVTLVRPGGAGADPGSATAYLYERVLEHLRGAAVVVVPVIDPARLTGLTEINDALALGKPLIVTRSPYLPFDVEAVGCGIAVEPGDETGWRAAIERLLGDAGLRRELGARGRAHAEAGFNYASFGAAVRAAVTRPLPA